MEESPTARKTNFFIQDTELTSALSASEGQAPGKDFVGQSTPMDRSLEADDNDDLDVSRVEIAEEFQRQQNERLQRLWKHQSEQNQKIFEKLDASMTRENRNACLREQHARQLEDTRQYYEGEIGRLKKQLSDMKGVVFQHKQQESSVKEEVQKEFENLSQANLELSSRCDALEAAKQLLQNQLKQENTRKLEVESQYQQLVATNQILDTRMMELKRKKEDSVGKLKEADAQRDALQTQCDILTKDKVILRGSKEEIERGYSQLQEDFQKLSDKYHKIRDESKIYRDRTKVQESLVEQTNKNVRELELVIETLKRELEDKKVKYEVDRSLFNATQRRVDRLVVQNRDKDLTIEDLEMKVKTLERTVKDVTANSAKAGLNEIRQSIQRDKELLKRILHEYDSLSDKHEKTKGHMQSLEGKLAKSQCEEESLRKELSEANITRKNLENSLREVLHGNQKSVPERSTRRTWEQPVSFSLPVDDVRMEQRMKFDGGRFEYTDPKESTRRFSHRAEKDSIVASPAVQRNEGRGYTKYEDKPHRHSYLDHGSDHPDSLACAYCNQLFKKGKNYGKAEEDAVDRRALLVSAEKRFLEFSEQRRRLESALRKISWSRMSKQDKEDKQFLETQLDEVLKELDKIRLQLKTLATD